MDISRRGLLASATALPLVGLGAPSPQPRRLVMVVLSGGWDAAYCVDPKENVPDNVKSAFKNIPTKLPGVQFTEILPKLSQVIDKTTLIRSMSGVPGGGRCMWKMSSP